MSCLHLNVKCLHRWQSVCTASTDSKSKKTRWEWRKPKYKVHNRLGYRCFGGIFAALEACQGRNDTSIMCRSLSMLPSYRSKNLIVDWIADLSCARTSIRDLEIPGCKSCHLTMNTWAMSQYLTPWDADLRFALTSVSNGSWLPGCGPGLELDRMVQFGLLPGIQGNPAGSGTGRNRSAVPYYGSCNFASNYVSEFWSYRDMIST